MEKEIMLVNSYLKKQGIEYQYTEDILNNKGNEMMKSFFCQTLGVILLNENLIKKYGRRR